MSTIANRFSALAVDDEAAPLPAPSLSRQTEPAITPTARSAQMPRRTYVPPNLRRNYQAPPPVTKSSLAPNIFSVADFPSLSSRHAPAVEKPAGASAGAGWSSMARDWASYEESQAAEQERERQRSLEERAKRHINVTLPPLTRTYNSVQAPLTYDETEEDNEIDSAEAYVGGYDRSRYAAPSSYDYEEDAASPNDDRNYDDEDSHTPPYSPTPY